MSLEELRRFMRDTSNPELALDLLERWRLQQPYNVDLEKFKCSYFETK